MAQPGPPRARPAKKILTFRFFPTEVRQQIFELCLVTHMLDKQYYRTTTHKPIPLLVVLRGDKELHEEALYLFYKINVLFYNIANFENFESPGGLERVKRVRHLGIDFHFEVHGVRDFSYDQDGTTREVTQQERRVACFLRFLVKRDPFTWRLKKVRTISKKVKNPPYEVDAIMKPCSLAAPQIESLYINTSTDTSGLYNVNLIVRQILVISKRLKEVAITLPLERMWVKDGDDNEKDFRHHWNYPGGNRSWNNLLIQINHFFAMSGEVNFGLSKGPEPRVMQVCWKAKKGEVLKMNEDIDPKCRKLHEGPCGNAVDISEIDIKE